MYHPSLLHPETRERYSEAQAPVGLSVRRQMEISLNAAEDVMAMAFAHDRGELWYDAWKRSIELRAQLAQ